MPSQREDLASNLRDTIVFGGLDEVYGCSMEKIADEKGKTYWSLTFCKARTLDGVIRVYSPTFILIKWNKNRKVVKSEMAAKEILMQFVLP